LERAGAASVALRTEFGFHSCKWATLHCQAKLYPLQTYDALAIYFSYRDFLDMIGVNEEKGNAPVPLEEDAAYPVFLAFRAACERLNSDTAWVMKQDWQTPKEFIAGREWMVLALQTHMLTSENFSLLFVNAELAKYLPPPLGLMHWSMS